MCFVKLRRELVDRLVRAEVLQSPTDPRVFSSMKEAVGRFAVRDA